MPNPFLKPIERIIRKGILGLLSLFKPRSRQLPPNFDFNKAKILCLRQNQIGDTLISTPIFFALKKRYPNLIIDVLLDKRNGTALDTNTEIRQRFVLKKSQFDFIEILAAIRNERYDCIVDLVHTESTTSTLFCLLGNSRFTIGFVRENDFIYDLKVPFHHHLRTLRALAEILTVFGISPDNETLKPKFDLTEDSIRFANQVLAPYEGKNIVGVNISASLKTKFWGVEKFSRLITLLTEAFPNCIFIILNSKAYEPEAKEITQQSNAKLSEETKTLSDFAALIASLDFLISPDSAAIHLADAFEIPCVILSQNKPTNQSWYPTFTKSITIHSPNVEISSIDIQSVYKASRDMLKSLGL